MTKSEAAKSRINFCLENTCFPSTGKEPKTFHRQIEGKIIQDGDEQQIN
jgi:hypothetical protein